MYYIYQFYYKVFKNLFVLCHSAYAVKRASSNIQPTQTILSCRGNYFRSSGLITLSQSSSFPFMCVSVWVCTLMHYIHLYRRLKFPLKFRKIINTYSQYVNTLINHFDLHQRSAAIIYEVQPIHEMRTATIVRSDCLVSPLNMYSHNLKYIVLT